MKVERPNLQQNYLTQDEMMKVLFSNDKERESPIKVLEHLALCHTVIIDPTDKNYSASSPDEKALVEGAKQHGVEFIKRDQNGEDSYVTIRVVSGKGPLEEPQEKKYKILNILEFDSDRKRMSVIVQDCTSK